MKANITQKPSRLHSSSEDHFNLINYIGMVDHLRGIYNNQLCYLGLILKTDCVFSKQTTLLTLEVKQESLSYPKNIHTPCSQSHLVQT